MERCQEIERLPFGQSHADKIRAAPLRTEALGRLQFGPPVHTWRVLSCREPHDRPRVAERAANSLRMLKPAFCQARPDDGELVILQRPSERPFAVIARDRPRYVRRQDRKID